MTPNSDFRERVQRIGALLQEIEGIADPSVRATTKELVQALIDLHGTALAQAMEMVSAAGELGMGLIDQLGRDPMVSSVLVLHGLHPEALDGRVLQAIERLKPKLRKQGCEIELMDLSEGAVRLRVLTGEHACGSTANTVRATVEGAIYDAAPDITVLTIEGLDGKPAGGFVALDTLMAGGRISGEAKAAD